MASEGVPGYRQALPGGRSNICSQHLFDNREIRILFEHLFDYNDLVTGVDNR